MLFCSSLISGAEVAYFSLAPNDVEKLNEDKSKKALLTLKLLVKRNILNKLKTIFYNVQVMHMLIMSYIILILKKL